LKRTHDCDEAQSLDTKIYLGDYSPEHFEGMSAKEAAFLG
jgi:hypothetical protein